jgi:hypothetical protein
LRIENVERKRGGLARRVVPFSVFRFAFSVQDAFFSILLAACAIAWEGCMGDRGKKDKDKGQKQHAAKDKQDEKRKLEKQPKRTS